MNANLKKSFWSDAAKAGGVIGGLLFLLYLANVLLRQYNIGWVISFLFFATLAVFIYRFSKARALKHGSEGFSFGQSMGYILTMMLFAGIIFGFGNFLLQNYVAPEYYNELFETALLKNPFYDPDSSAAEDMADLMRRLMKSPVFLVFAGIFDMVIYGGGIGLLASAFVRTKPDIFADTGDGQSDAPEDDENK